MTESKANIVIKSGLWYVVGNFSTKAAGFLSMPLFTRLLTKSEIGDYANFVSWINILVVVCTFDLFSSVMLARFDFKDDLNDYISSNLIFGTCITAVCYIAFLFTKESVLHVTGLSEWEFQIAFIYMAVYPAAQMFLSRCRILFEYKVYVVYSICSAFISIGTSLVGSLLCTDRLMGRVVGEYIPLILMSGILYCFFLKKQKKFKYVYIKYGLSISVPLIWQILANSILSTSDRIMISNIEGYEATALYSVAYYCGLIVSVLSSSLINTWAPWAYEQMNQENYYSLRKMSKPYILFFSIVVSIFLLLAPELLLIVGGESYIKAIGVIPPVMVAIVFQFLYSFYANIELFYKKQIYVALGTSFVAIINLFLNYVFIPVYGYIAAAYTTLAGYVVLLFIHYLFVRSFGKTHFYDTKFTLCIGGSFFIVSFIMPFIYDMSELRLFILLALSAFFSYKTVSNKKVLIENVKKKSIKGIISCYIKL